MKLSRIVGLWPPFSEGTISDVVPTREGVEVTLPINRMHFILGDGRTHFTLPTNRLHFTVREEDQ